MGITLLVQNHYTSRGAIIIFSGAGDSNQRYALLMTAKKTKKCYTEFLHFISSLHHMVELAHVVKSCSDLTIYASGLSQPEKLMDSLKTNGLTKN